MLTGETEARPNRQNPNGLPAVEVRVANDVYRWSMAKELGVYATPHIGNLPLEFRLARDFQAARVLLYDWCNQPDDQGQPWLVKYGNQVYEIASKTEADGKLAAYIKPNVGFDKAKRNVISPVHAAETPAQLHALLGKAPTYSEFVLTQDQRVWRAVIETLNKNGIRLFGRVINADGASSPFIQQAPIEDPFGVMTQTAEHLAEAIKPGGDTTPHAGDLIPTVDFTAYLIMLSGAIEAGKKPRYDHHGRLINFHVADYDMLKPSYTDRLAENFNRMHALVVREVDNPNIPDKISFQLFPAINMRPSYGGFRHSERKQKQWP